MRKPSEFETREAWGDYLHNIFIGVWVDFVVVYDRDSYWRHYWRWQD